MGRFYFLILLIVVAHCGLDGVDGDDGSDGVSPSASDGVDGGQGRDGLPFRWGTSDRTGAYGDGVIASTSDLDAITCDENHINEFYQVKYADDEQEEGFYYCDGTNWIFGWKEGENPIWPFSPTVPDINFRKCLNSYLGLGLSNTADITINGLGTLTGTVTCTQRSITNLEGVQYLTNVSILDLSYNEINSIPPSIILLTQLTTLDLSYNAALSLVDQSGDSYQGADDNSNVNANANDNGNSNSNSNSNDNEDSVLDAAALSLGAEILFDSLSTYALSTTYKGDSVATKELIVTDGKIHVHVSYANGRLVLKHNPVPDLNFRKCIHMHLKALFSSQFSGRSNISPLTWSNLEQITGVLTCEYRNIKDIRGVENLLAITSLKLSHNAIYKIPAEIKLLAANLQDFAIENNQISGFPDKFFDSLIALKTLNVAGNNLTEIPSTIKNLIELTALNVSGNTLSSLPSLKLLTKLLSVDASANELTSLPTDIKYLTSLTTLDLSDNFIESVSSNIGVLVALTRLDLGYNQIESIPGEIGNLIALKELILARNHIYHLPAISTDLVGIDSLTNLENIDLQGNSSVQNADNFDALTSGIGAGIQITDFSHTFNIVLSGTKLVVTEVP